MLVGREREREEVERLLAAARAGETASLVLRGEPGVGKTALLRHAVERAEGMTVVRATGIESEAELEFSGLLELLRPLAADLDDLPERQAATLRAALGLADGPVGDRFALGAATLGLLAAAAERQALLVLVDDAQWLDRVSAEALLFAARRLLADRVAFLFAARGERFEAHGLPELRLGGLDRGSAARVLETAAGRPLPGDVVEFLWAATAGNPLALSELPAVLEPDQLDGRRPLDALLPVTAGIERAFAGRLGRVSEGARRALGVLAVSGTGGLADAVRALERLGLDAGALDEAEDAGLLALSGDALDFRHPLMRAVVHEAMSATERRAAHRALADVLVGPGEAERRAWHLASAAVGIDDDAADALAEAAEAARARGGQAAAASAFERAAALAGDPGRAVLLLAQAAEAAWAAGSAPQALALVERALEGVGGDDRLRARLLGLGGRIRFQTGSQREARATLLHAAELLEPHDRVGGAVLLGYAWLATYNLAEVGTGVEIAERGRALAAGGGEPYNAMLSEYVLGRAYLAAGRGDESTPLLESALAELRSRPDQTRVVLRRSAMALLLLDRAGEATAAASRAVAEAREAGPLELVYALSLSTQVRLLTGDWTAGRTDGEEGIELARALGLDIVAAHLQVTVAAMAATRAESAGVREMLHGRLAALERLEDVLHAEQARWLLGVLDLVEDRLDEAASTLEACARRLGERGVLDRFAAPEPDLVEALVRLGRAGDATAWLDGWEARGAGRAGRWGPPLVARCRALLGPDDALDDGFGRALELHGPVGEPYQEARTRLAYGERLRRAGRRVDGREQLRAALELFEGLGATAWAERVRRELRASGEKLRQAAEAGEELTPQELQIALQVAEGKSNKEAAAAMFLSPKTVEFHLSRIYRKLGIGSRAELLLRFAAAEPEPAAAPAGA